MRLAAGLALVLALSGAPGLARALAHEAEAAPAPRVHVVRRGDTLGALARRYGVTVGALVAANRLAGPDAILRIGRRLVGPTALARRAIARSAPPAVTPRTPGDLVVAVPDFGDAPPEVLWPVDGTVTSPFGRRRGGWHRGIDIKAAAWWS